MLLVVQNTGLTRIEFVGKQLLDLNGLFLQFLTVGLSFMLSNLLGFVEKFLKDLSFTVNSECKFGYDGMKCTSFCLLLFLLCFFLISITNYLSGVLN